MFAIPEGKSVFIYQLQKAAGGNTAALVKSIQAGGFQNVFIKFADGEVDVNQALLGPTIEELDKIGVKVWGWSYLYGATKSVLLPPRSIASIEADAVIRNMQKYNFAGYIMDPEDYYKRSGAGAWAATFTQKLRAALPAVSIGLCSYRFPSYHPELPWKEFLSIATFHAPQVYWVDAHNPGSQLQRSFTELGALADLPFVPIGSAYAEGAWAGPNVAELDEFNAKAKSMNLPGVGWWCFDDNGLQDHPDWYEAISRHVWKTSPLPPPPINPGGGTLIQRVANLENWARSQGYTG